MLFCTEYSIILLYMMFLEKFTQWKLMNEGTKHYVNKLE